MASQSRNQKIDLAGFDQLQKAPYKFRFYQALRLLECQNPDKPRIGHSSKPDDDPVRLGQTPSLLFAPSSIASFQAKNALAAKLKVYFFGAFGPNGPLPLHLTEYARNRIRHAKDDSFAEFVDIFHHRLLSFFYRAWADKEPTVQLDRPDHDRFSFYIGSLAGLAEASQRHRDKISDHFKFHFAANFAGHTRHALGLKAILENFLQVPINIQELVGEWLDIPDDSYCYLNSDENTGQLGMSAVIGTKTWQCQHKFRILIGPLTLQQYEGLLPKGDNLFNLRDLVRNYVGFEFSWDVNLWLKPEETPVVQLGQYGQLGWTSWLQAGKRESTVKDLYLNIEANA